MEILFSTTLDAVIGCMLKDKRQRLRHEQADIAKLLSFQPSTLSKIETGSVKITVEYVAMLCGIYNVRLSDFFAILEECVNFLKTKQVLVYTPKTAQYFTIGLATTSKNIQKAKGMGGTAWALLPLLPLPVLSLSRAVATATALLTTGNNKIEQGSLPPNMIGLTGDQLSQMLSVLLNDKWGEIDNNQQQKD